LVGGQPNLRFGVAWAFYCASSCMRQQFTANLPIAKPVGCFQLRAVPPVLPQSEQDYSDYVVKVNQPTQKENWY